MPRSTREIMGCSDFEPVMLLSSWATVAAGLLVLTSGPLFARYPGVLGWLLRIAPHQVWGIALTLLGVVKWASTLRAWWRSAWYSTIGAVFVWASVAILIGVTGQALIILTPALVACVANLWLCVRVYRRVARENGHRAAMEHSGRRRRRPFRSLGGGLRGPKRALAVRQRG